MFVLNVIVSCPAKGTSIETGLSPTLKEYCLNGCPSTSMDGSGVNLCCEMKKRCARSQRDLPPTLEEHKVAQRGLREPWCPLWQKNHVHAHLRRTLTGAEIVCTTSLGIVNLKAPPGETFSPGGAHTFRTAVPALFTTQPVGEGATE